MGKETLRQKYRAERKNKELQIFCFPHSVNYRLNSLHHEGTQTAHTWDTKESDYTIFHGSRDSQQTHPQEMG
jgi:hypothetical protein